MTSTLFDRNEGRLLPVGIAADEPSLLDKEDGAYGVPVVLGNTDLLGPANSRRAVSKQTATPFMAVRLRMKRMVTLPNAYDAFWSLRQRRRIFTTFADEQPKRRYKPTSPSTSNTLQGSGS